ncbi:hypothetical protein N9Q38_02160 [Pseudomonadales bacterium]|nr:hypothetical protein [Pseudomonadales bacterium]
MVQSIRRINHVFLPITKHVFHKGAPRIDRIQEDLSNISPAMKAEAPGRGLNLRFSRDQAEPTPINDG